MSQARKRQRGDGRCPLGKSSSKKVSTRNRNEGIGSVFLQNIAERPQQRTDAEDPANRILRAARGNECSNRRECQQNQGIKNITEQPRGRILHLKQQRNDGNDQVECPGEPCKTKGSALAHGFSFPGSPRQNDIWVGRLPPRMRAIRQIIAVHRIILSVPYMRLKSVTTSVTNYQASVTFRGVDPINLSEQTTSSQSV